MAPLDESESHACIAEGYDELIYNVAPENYDSVLRQLDRIAVLANKLRK